MNPEGQFDLQQLMAAAQQMQEQIMSAQAELTDAEVEGTSGGGLVKARVNGQGEVTEISISPAAIDSGDPADTAETVSDLVLAAVRDAYRAVAELQEEKMGPLAAGLSDVPGLGQSGIGPGGPGPAGLNFGPGGLDFGPGGLDLGPGGLELGPGGMLPGELGGG